MILFQEISGHFCPTEEYGAWVCGEKESENTLIPLFFMLFVKTMK